MSCKCGDNGKDENLQKILETYTQDKSNLIQILNEVQEKYGYIPKFAQEEISKYLEIPMAEIYGVITFYARFSLKPKGKYNIAVCLGTACFVKGSEKVLDKVKEFMQNESQLAYEPIADSNIKDYEGDLVFFAATGGKTISTFVTEKPGWKKLKAVQENRVGVIDMDTFAQKGVLLLYDQYSQILDAFKVALKA